MTDTQRIYLLIILNYVNSAILKHQSIVGYYQAFSVADEKWFF